MNTKIYVTIILCFIQQIVFAQYGIGDNFDDNVLSCYWTKNTPNTYTLTETNQVLEVNVNTPINTSGVYDDFILSFPPIDLSLNSVLTLKIKSSSTFILRVDLGDENVITTNETPLSVQVTNSGSLYKTYSFDFANYFKQSYPLNAIVDKTKISGIAIFVNPGIKGGYKGTFFVDDIQLGTDGIHNGNISSCTITSLNSEEEAVIKQVHIYPNPLKDIVNVEFKGDCTLKVLSSQGADIITYKFIDNIKLDMSNYAKGLYFYEVHNSNSIQRKTVIIE